MKSRLVMLCALAAIEAGADGIQTDHPEELVNYLRENGYRKR
jgi:hypothetical protein